jgi:hypothetical protein
MVRASRERVNQVMADFVKRRWIERPLVYCGG